MASRSTSSIPVVYHDEAVVEFQKIKEKASRKKILTVVSILKQAGGRLTEPHAKKVKGETKLFELRPGGGKLTLRPLYAKINEQIVILTIAPESEVDPKGFANAVARAKKRAQDDFQFSV